MFKVKVALCLILVLLAMPAVQIGSDAIDNGILTAPLEEKLSILQDNGNYKQASLKLAITPVKAVNDFLEGNFMSHESKRASDNMWKLMGDAFGVGGNNLNSVLDNFVSKL